MKLRNSSQYSRRSNRYTGTRSRSGLYRRTPQAAQLHLPVASIRPLLIVLAISILLWLLFASPFFRVTRVKTEGLRTVPEAAVQQTVQDVVKNSHLLIFRRDSEWLYPVDTLTATLKDRYPVLSAVNIQRSFPHDLLIKVEERSVSLVWQSGDGNYLVDGDGIVTGLAPAGFKPEIAVKDTTNIPVSAGKQVLSRAYIAFISAVYDQLPKRTGAKITSVSVAETTLETTVATDKGYTIFFDTTRSADSQIANLSKILAQLKAQRQTLDYIDLRVDNRIFYKTK